MTNDKSAEREDLANQYPISTFHGRTQEELIEFIIAYVDEKVLEVQSKHITDLAYAVGELQGLGHPNALLERHYREAIATLNNNKQSD